MKNIISLQNELIIHAKKLQDKKYRKQYNKCLLEGEKLIKEAILSNIKIEMIFIEEGKCYNFISNLNCEKYIVTNKIIKHLSKSVSPQGIVAVIDTNYQIKSISNNCLILDNIQNPDNLGAIIRTAVATNFTKIYTINCVDVFNEKVLRASMGTAFKTEVIEIDYQFVNQLKNEYSVYYADMQGVDIFSINKFDKNIAIVIGNEGNGISQEVRKLVNKTLSIPMQNNVESLNASVSASIIMYQIFTKQKC